MPAQVGFCEDYGASVGLSPRGTSRVTGQTNWNWSNNADPTLTYSDYPITAGNRSFAKYNFLTITGTYNMLTGFGYSHTGLDLGIGLSVFGFISGSGMYVTPATTLPTLFTVNFTPTGLTTSGLKIGAGGPELSGKGLNTTVNPAFTEYIGHQLTTTASAPAGDSTGTYFHYFSYTEN